MKLIATLPSCLFVLLGSAQKKKNTNQAPKLSATELAIRKMDSSIAENIKDSNVTKKVIPHLGKDLHELFSKKQNTRNPRLETAYTQPCKPIGYTEN